MSNSGATTPLTGTLSFDYANRLTSISYALPGENGKTGQILNPPSSLSCPSPPEAQVIAALFHLIKKGQPQTAQDQAISCKMLDGKFQ